MNVSKYTQSYDSNYNNHFGSYRSSCNLRSYVLPGQEGCCPVLSGGSGVLDGCSGLSRHSYRKIVASQCDSSTDYIADSK